MKNSFAAMSVKPTKAERVAALEKSARLAQDLQNALAICSADISQYTLIWEKVARLFAADLAALDDLVRNMALSGHTAQPPLEGCATTHSNYYAWLEIEFQDIDSQIFTHAKALAMREGVDFHDGPPKKQERVMEKADFAYNNDLSQLKDYRRASLVCPDIPAILRIVKAVQDDPALTVCRAKNRFSKNYDAMLSCGYRDLQLNIVTEEGFIWELQIHLADIEQLKTSMRDTADASGRTGHQRYVAFRTIRERMEDNGRPGHEVPLPAPVPAPADKKEEAPQSPQLQQGSSSSLPAPPPVEDQWHIGLLDWIRRAGEFSDESVDKYGRKRFEPRCPKSKEDLLALTTLNLYDCNISGQIPESLGNCIKLEVLQLYSNKLQGQIPESIGNCKGLVELVLSENQLEVTESFKKTLGQQLPDCDITV